MPRRLDQALRDAPDHDLVARIRRHPADVAAWTELYRRCYPGMLRTAVLTLRGQPELAEDLVHDVFVRALDSGALAALQSPDLVRRYLAVAARRAALDIIRSPAVSRTVAELDPESLVDSSLWEEHAADRAAAVEEALSRLAPEDSTVLRLLLQGYSLSEIAARLDLKYDAAAQRVSRARRRLLG